MKPTLIEDWKQAWKWFSVQGLLLIAFVQLLWPEVPQEIRDMLGPQTQRWITLVLTAITLWGRVVQQGPKDTSSSA